MQSVAIRHLDKHPGQTAPASNDRVEEFVVEKNVRITTLGHLREGIAGRSTGLRGNNGVSLADHFTLLRAAGVEKVALPCGKRLALQVCSDGTKTECYAKCRGLPAHSIK